MASKRIIARRRRRIEMLCVSYGTQSALAERLGVTQGYIAQIVGGFKPLGDVGAYNIERKLRLPAGYLDAV